ncbi:tetratricopeptide repeat protein [Leptospira kirschneri]|uniref:tetratricopeptide repeat protein n=1 Tax=Leptospira kirschneri TaxID=29507 RepID=UPI0002977666|nr:tetratricopeptide repeat protein [Leptospira kirschneri]EKQ83028.1 anaphase-promoting complex, cyclosome, subunit 3 [Leptospira kirschneri serovar Grippotyphosa str. Moskva]EKR09574.1 anaphase-promoting complex, cyclosome, subunit 3 [Leptospira kirschneri serovar Valbuzzi str. 200702274]OOV47047.1 anaphase-promoting complex, cyclosome, subunit 3 [Leptospira kirschneri serovar Grippotyphosa]UZW35782.1 tetratricopeptide repeat protein [Leptospira kirschneri]WHO99483.1 tetratricopeptide repeat
MDKEIRKNRLFLEGIEEEEFYFPEDKEPVRVRRSYNKLIIFWILMGLFVLGGIGFAVYHQFFRTSSAGSEFAGAFNKDLIQNKSDINRLLERPYIPDGNANPALTKCINLYKERFTRQAFDTCNEFLNSTGTQEEKSIALTVLGVIHDESGRYPQAIERLQKAIQYDPKNFYAYYNLTLSYKHAGRFADARMAALKAKEIAPNDPRVSLLAGNLFNELNDPDSAIDAYKEGLSASPDDMYLTYNLGVSYFKKGEIPQAEEEFKKVVIKTPSGRLAALSHSYLGNIAYNKQDYKNAEYHFRQASNLSPNEAKYLYNLAIVLQKNGNKEEALKYLELARDAGANDPEIYRLIAEGFSNLNQGEMSISALQKSLKYNPTDLDSLFQLAEAYYNKGDLLSAEETYRRIVSSTPGDSFTETALINLGVVLDQMERYGEAVATLNRVIELNPKNAKAYHTLGIVYKHSGNGTLAIENWRKSTAIEPENIQSREALGDYLLENKFFREAIEEYTGLVKHKDDAYKVYLKMAEAYMGMQDDSNAEKILLKVLNSSRDGADLKNAHKKLALLYNKSKDPDLKNRAKDEAFRSAHMDPNDMEGRLVLAKILIDSNSILDREKAIDELTAIVRSDVRPKTAATAYNYLGICYYKNGEFKRAVRAFQSSIDLDPSLSEAYENKRAASAALEENTRREGYF